jgi:hypothetical protein
MLANMGLIIQSYEMIAPVRRMVVISAPLLTLLACGAAVALAASGGESTPISKAHAVAFAHAVNLRAGDVPDLRSFGRRGGDAAGQVVSLWFRLTPMSGCGSADRGEEFDVFSPIFRRLDTKRIGRHVSLPAEGLQSKVAIKQSAAEQERDFAAHLCDEAHFEAARRSARRQDLPSPLPGVRVLGVRTWRTAPRAWFGTANVTMYSDGFSFVVGPAEIVLAITSAPRPPRAELEQRLLSLLYGRAEAHKL